VTSTVVKPACCSDPGLLDYADNQGDEVHDEAVKDGDKPHFNTTPNNIGRDVFMLFDKIGRL
jgi:hypothetical protein